MTEEQIDAQIAQYWFVHHFRARMIGLSFAMKCELADRAMERQKGITAFMINRVAELAARVEELEASACGSQSSESLD